MNKESIVSKIKLFLGMVKGEFQTVKLEDGTEYSVEKLEVGAELLDSEGNVVADGEYKTEDGTIITVSEGKITEIKTPDEMECKEPEEESTLPDGTAGKEEDKEPVKAEEETPVVEDEETPTEDTITPRVEALEQKIDELYEMILAITEKMKESETKVEETVQEFKQIKSQPSATPLHFGKTEQDAPMSRIEKLKALKNNK